MDKINSDIRKWAEGGPGVYEIGPVTPDDFLSRIADSGMPGSLFARLCLEHPEVEIGKRLELDAESK